MSHDRVKELEEQVTELAKALEEILSNAGLDWYVQQMSKPEISSGDSSGIVAKIHNSDVRDRALMAYERARKVLQKFKSKTV